jgi:geranylgeranyl diphosphate synthase type II
MISLKTAVLPGAALKIGALIAGANEQDANHLYEFGKNTGIAFQLQDDLLDLYADGEKFGKQTGGDIVANKKTFLLLKAKELAKGGNVSRLKNIFDGTDFPKKVAAAKSLYEKLGVRKESEKMMRHFHRLAMGDLQKVNLPAEKKQPLLDFAGMLMVREA